MTPHLFTGAIPLLINAETFGCSLTGLARCISPSTTWTPMVYTKITILTLNLARTPDLHSAQCHRAPNLIPSTISSLLATGLQTHATAPSGKSTLSMQFNVCNSVLFVLASVLTLCVRTFRCQIKLISIRLICSI